ncbi:MAG: hypothetical protein GY708_00310 [Actinomycetia bacterium]|nr:hypothetical protein [Actinomycetes bacterium]
MKHHVDARWLMAYAASLDEVNPAYFDTTTDEGIVGHPLFVVCPEWPVIVETRGLTERSGVSPAEIQTGVHATHDLTVHRLVRPGDVLVTSLETTGVVGIKPGVKWTVRLRTVDADGRSVATTTQDSIYLGVRTDGHDRPDPSPPPEIAGSDRIADPDEFEVRLPAGAAHTYTECARIWNPIHTDKAVALAAGLPDIILHGTANLAHGVSAVIRHRAGGRPELLRRVACRFAAMVELPSTITVRVWPANDTGDGKRTVPFEVLNADGAPAVKDGLIVLART